MAASLNTGFLLPLVLDMHSDAAKLIHLSRVKTRVITRVITILSWVALVTLSGYARSSLADKNPLAKEIYHNATIAAEQGQFRAVLQNWFLYQSLVDSEKMKFDKVHFLPILWTAADKLDLCFDQIQTDLDTANIWTIALYNYIARHRRDIKGKNSNPANLVSSFEKGVQSRTVNAASILDAEDIASLQPYRDDCDLTSTLLSAQIQQFSTRTSKPSQERKNRAELLLTILKLVKEKAALTGGETWLSSQELALSLYISDDKDKVDPRYEQTILSLVHSEKQKLLTIAPEMRLYLLQIYAKANESGDNRRNQLIRWLDFAIETEDPRLISHLLGTIYQLDPERLFDFWKGIRGDNMLRLAEKKVTNDGAPIAMARALDAYANSQIIESLKMLAIAIRLAPDASGADLDRLAMSWIKHILIQYRFDQRLLDFIESYLDRARIREIFQDLLWRSALMGEKQLVSKSRYSDYLNSRLKQNLPYLELVASRRFESFVSRLRIQQKNEQRQALHVAQELIAHVKKEPFPVMEELIPLLKGIHRELESQLANENIRKKIGQELLEEYDRVLVHGTDTSHFQQDRRIRTGNAIDIGAMIVPPSSKIPWNLPTNSRININVFRQIPYRLSHVHKNGEVTITWNLETP